MNGTTHDLVAMLAMACLNTEERHILYPRWGGIESGATLSDEFRIMWEPVAAGKKERELVHRCFVDSDNPKDHGCITRALDHSDGSVSFIQSYLDGKLDGYTEDEFLENLGMFLGVVSHHIADLCTSVHVGHRMDYKRAGARSRAAFHGKVEKDIERLGHRCSLKLFPAEMVTLSRDFFWSIAKETYETAFVRLEATYSDHDEDGVLATASSAISRAVRHTRDVWHTILSNTAMTSRTWSMQPLL
jgi:hypothetical protein